MHSGLNFLLPLSSSTYGGSHGAAVGFATGFFAVVVGTGTAVAEGDAEALAVADAAGASRSAVGVADVEGAAAEVEAEAFGVGVVVDVLADALGAGPGSIDGLGTGGVVTFGFDGADFGGSLTGCPRFAIA